jgi:uncharacterized membrane protein YphA (DoxX/SURF4 family)
MHVPDLVVGSLGVIAGAIFVAAAATDWLWLQRLPKWRVLTEAIGKPAARIVAALVGLALIAGGIVIATGWRIHWGV